MRTIALIAVATTVLAGACVSTPHAGPLGEGFDLHPAITSVDTAHPPQYAWIDLDQQDYVALLLVQPGRGVTLLYPRDSIIDNRLSAGAHQLTFLLRPPRVLFDSLNRARRRTASREDSMRVAAARRSSSGPPRLNIDSYLLLFASPQPISYDRVHDKLAGVSIPLEDLEALSAVSKAVKSTLTVEPREWSGYYHLITIAPPN